MAKEKSTKKNLLQEIADYTVDHKGLFFVVGNPETDEVIVSFNEKISFIKFPISFDRTNNVLVRMLNGSTFAQGMSDFISGLTKGIEADVKGKATKTFMNQLGGAVQSMVDFSKKTKQTHGKN